MGQRVLLVEGKNDAIVVANLLEHHRVPERFRIEQAGDVDSRFTQLPLRLS